MKYSTKSIKNDNITRIELIRQRLKKKNYVVNNLRVAHEVINIELALLKVS